MSIGLLSQLDTYYSQIDEAQEPLSIDEIMELRLSTEPVRPIGPSPPAASLLERRPWLASVAAAAAVLVLFGGVMWLSRVSGSDAPPAAPPSSFTWTRVPHDEAIFGEASMSSVTAGGPGLVAVGVAWDHPSRDPEVYPGYAAVWTSPDGATWSRVPHDEAVFGEASMSSVTAGGPGLVAVGDGDLGAAVWTSPDGVTWTRVPHDQAVFGEASMSSVTVGGPGLVAVGTGGPAYVWHYDVYEVELIDAAVWTSVDGVTWTRVPHDEAIFGEASMLSVTAGGPGLVAVGGAEDHAVVWTSVDGVTWSRVPHDEAVLGRGGQWMNSVIAGGPGLVAVGRNDLSFLARSSPVGGAGVWTSPDGFTWSWVRRAEGTGRAPGGGRSLWSITEAGPGLVAVGEEGAVWTSVDGITWSREAIFGGVSVNSVTVGGPGLVAVGTGGRIWDEGWYEYGDAVVWVATTND